LPGIADCYANLGTLNRDMGRYDEALKFYHSCLEIDTKNGDSLYMAVGFNDIAGAYLKMDDYDSSLHYFNRAYTILKKINSLGNLV